MFQHLFQDAYTLTASYFVNHNQNTPGLKILGVESGGSGGRLLHFLIVLLHFSNVTPSFTVKIPVAVLDFLVQEPLPIIQAAIADLPLEECLVSNGRCYGDALRQISLNG